MQIPVLVERLPGGAFRASTGSPLCVTAEGTSQPVALASVRELIEARLAAGASIVFVDIGPANVPLVAGAGIFDPDDPLVQEWEKEVAEYRRQRDKELEAL